MKDSATDRRRPFGRLLWPLLVAIVVAPLLCLAFGLGVQWRTVKSDVISTQEPPGRLVEVDGATMHLDCRGDGAPTVVLESGIVSTSRIWEAVQAPLATQTRVCSYDRRGYGWSDPAGTVRDGERIASELWQLLDAAGESPPFLLVGHSAGGLYVRAAQALRPDAVMGLVLVDPSVEAMGEVLDDPAQFDRIATVFRQEARRHRLGFVHLPFVWAPPKPTFPEYPRAERTVLAALLSRPGFLEDAASELETLMTTTSDFVRANRQASSELPLVVLSRDPSRSDGREGDAEVAAWVRAHGVLAARSSRGEHLITAVDSHDLHVQAPELVVGAIERLVELWRPSVGAQAAGHAGSSDHARPSS